MNNQCFHIVMHHNPLRNVPGWGGQPFVPVHFPLVDRCGAPPPLGTFPLGAPPTPVHFRGWGKNQNFDPDPKNVVITKLFAPKFCAEWSNREVHSSHRDHFRDHFHVYVLGQLSSNPRATYGQLLDNLWTAFGQLLGNQNGR